MRTIKFRVWDPNNEIMYTNVGIGQISLYDFDGDRITEQEGLVIMQYTGLKDKTDVEVYEGDIVHVEDRGKCVICYDSHQLKYKAVPVSLYLANAGNGGWTGFEIKYWYPVIGNIYENVDLLSKEDEA